MDSQTKRTFLAASLCLLVLFGWLKFIETRYPRPQRPLNPPTETASPGPSNETARLENSPVGPEDSGPAPEARVAAPKFHAVSAEQTQVISLGHDGADEDNPFKFKADISAVGAGVNSIHLAEHRNKVAKDKKNPDHDPYTLLETVKDAGTGNEYRSFVIEKVRLIDEDADLSFDDVVWSSDGKTSDGDGESVSLSTMVKRGNDDFLRFTKTYRLDKGSYHLRTFLDVENLSDKPHRIALTVRGPIGVKKEDVRWDGRRVVSAVIDEDGSIVDGENETGADVEKSENHSIELTYDRESRHLYWSALGNKYFTCVVVPRPLRDGQSYPDYFTKVSADTEIQGSNASDGLTLAQVFAPTEAIGPRDSLTFPIEIYCGPKSHKLFDELREARDRNYFITAHADQSMCTFGFVTDVMYWLLTNVYKVVRNYGIAIIILVIIVRLVLHPVSKRGQLNMMKMQKNQQRIKPKMELLQQQYKNDKQKLQEEQMKLYREEGVNPAGALFGCLPMVLQMPIWVALWTTLNTNVEMRHEPFFGYIRDLSAPDALIAFSGSGYNIPLLWQIMGSITSFNLLPILMAGIMYGQQKLTQKLTKPDKPVAPKLDADGNPLPDTMAQQQKIMNFMMIFMGLFFYNFPSGLCLYILSSSLLGMGEQYYIRKHLKDQEARGEFDAKKKAPKEPGWFSRKIQEAQKMAEQQRLAQPKRPDGKPKKPRKKARF
ncbi:MAG: membrane protein insertase YidC [Phycisphaerales bacterium]|nr:membrane protein insertase YidC [Phycisphaerales bacterium]